MLYFFLRSDLNPQVSDTIFDALFEDFKLFENLSDSIPERLEKVIENKGGWIYFFVDF
jgi:hypothetical protein